MTRSSSTCNGPRLIAALAGGWVADAASLGLHWLYNSQRIIDIGAETPEFLPPKAEYFSEGFGYFAHEGKQTGDTSHYGANQYRWHWMPRWQGHPIRQTFRKPVPAANWML